MNSHTSLTGIYQVTMSLRDMHALMYQAATARRLRTIVKDLLVAQRSDNPTLVTFCLTLLEELAQEEGWLAR